MSRRGIHGALIAVVVSALSPVIAAPVVESRPILTSADDAEENASGVVDLTSSDLELVTDGSKVQTVGLRFDGVTVPRGAAVTAAWMQFRVDEVSTGAASLTIRGQAVDDAPVFEATPFNVSSRARTVTAVPWTPPDWPAVGETGTDQRTPGLEAIITEITGRDGWQPGNALALIVTGSGRRTAESFEGSGGPILRIEYEDGAAPASVTFTAGGDYGATPVTSAGLAALDRMMPDFHIANGDFAYTDLATEQEWCDYVRSNMPVLGPEFPFQIVGGDAETDSQPKKLAAYAACLPDRLSSTLSPTNQYGAEYFFDLPHGAPLIRTIMIAADQKINGIRYNYVAGKARANWLAAAIDGARNAGIPWVVVAMHEVCQTAGKKDCSVGPDLMNLLFAKKVDLVLQAHDHNYQRSKQIALDASTCPAVPVGVVDADCIIDDGSDNDYRKGAGSVVIINGAFGGRGLSAVNPADSEAGYFATIHSKTRGFSAFTVTADRIEGRFVPTAGSYTDSFVVRAG